MPVRSFLETYLYTAEPQTLGAPMPVRNERRAPIYLARQFDQILLGLLTEALLPSGVTPSQWGVIAALARDPGMDQKRLCERRSIDPNSASRLVDELSALGWVRREQSPDDRRANALHLTATGKKKFLRFRPAAMAAQERALEPLANAEKRVLLDLLTRVVSGNLAYARPGNGRRRPARKSAVSSVPGPAVRPARRRPAASAV